jgi:hypothetical protein
MDVNYLRDRAILTNIGLEGLQFRLPMRRTEF